MSDDRKPLFHYNNSSRRAILTSIDLSEGALSNELVEMCELLAQIYICNVDFFADYPNNNEANDRIYAILYHLREVLRHADFDGDHNRRKNFWVTVFIDGNGVLPPDRWFGWSKFARSMEAAHHHLRRFAERRLQALQFENVGGSSALENGYLKQLSCAYYHILKRKPGRSKSTIGPFGYGAGSR